MDKKIIAKRYFLPTNNFTFPADNFTFPADPKNPSITSPGNLNPW